MILPVIHNRNIVRQGTTLHIGNYNPDDRRQKRVDDWFKAFMASDLVIVQKGVKDAAGIETTQRDGYLGVFRRGPVRDGTTHFELIERIQ